MNGRIKRGDIILLAVLLAAALAAYFLWSMGEAPENGVVVITVDGEEYARLPLNEDAVLEIKTEGLNILEIKDGKASVTHADCPDGICVRHRPISRTGEMIICLPNKVEVTVEDAGESVVDLVT